MAAKKPAKTSFSSQQTKLPEMPGKAVMYMSPTKGENAFECPTCKRTLSKGIIYEHASSLFCTRNCIPKTENK